MPFRPNPVDESAQVPCPVGNGRAGMVGMFESDVLDIAIGMVLIFLMMSIIMTAVQEALEGWLKTRATHLERALVELFQGDAAAVRAFYAHPLVFALYRGDAPMGKGQGPTYIPRESYSAALMDMIHRGDPLPPGLKQAYAGLQRVAGEDVGRLRREVEGWYDGAMDRASGWFKRRTQRNLFLMGLAAALLLNINAVGISQFLNANHTQRERLLRLAEKQTPESLASDAKQLGFEAEIYDLGMPVGWNAAARKWTFREFNPPPGTPAGGVIADRILPAVGLAAGYLITALATMLGAPFWFDVLNRLMVIRSTVKPKEKSPDEPSADGGKADAKN